MFTVNSSGHNTRSSQKLQVIQHNSELFTNSVKYFSTKLWNSLSSATIDQILDSDPKTAGNVRSILVEHVIKNRYNDA